MPMIHDLTSAVCASIPPTHTMFQYITEPLGQAVTQSDRNVDPQAGWLQLNVGTLILFETKSDVQQNVVLFPLDLPG